MSTFSRLLLAFVLLFTVTGVLPVSASGGQTGSGDPTPDPLAPAYTSQVYLPVVIRPFPYTVSGQITNNEGQPISGVTMSGSTGLTTQTGTDGSYSMGAGSGPYAVAPYKEGYSFEPAMIDLNLNSPVTGQDFTAVSACTEAVQNGGFESSTWWNLLEGPGYYPAAYATLPHSGSRSVRTGITNPSDIQNSESRVRSPAITIPAGTGSAVLRLWLYPVSTEAVSQAQETQAAEPQAPNAELPSTAFGDMTLAADAQYVKVLNANNVVLATLTQFRSNNQYWSLHQFELAGYAGQTIKIEIGTYNDAYNGVTALYADDVSLTLCGGTPPPPPPPPTDTCTNQVVNSNFEYNGNWNIPYTAYPAGYSYDFYVSAARSMRTGIPLYNYGNTYSYSDSWQNVVIPSGASAKLKMYLLPRSEETYATMMDENSKLPDVAEDAPKFTEEQVWDEQALSAEASDAQYVLLLNPSTGAILQTLLWWQPRNASGWQYREFDLSAYAGRTVRVQFGTFNNGYGGRSVMYVDNVVLDTCGSTTPPPPPTCTERITNGGFESNSAWYLPNTAFSAGYSTYLKRSGARSMRTGIVYWYHNRYSYSDASQLVTIPAGTASATLKFYIYSMSGELAASKVEGAAVPELDAQVSAALSPTAATLGAEAMAGDVQYVLVLDRYGNWLDTLVWRRSNESYWRLYQFNLNRFAGQTIRLQWGTYNNGSSGVTSMYVDDVSLQACP